MWVLGFIVVGLVLWALVTFLRREGSRETVDVMRSPRQLPRSAESPAQQPSQTEISNDIHPRPTTMTWYGAGKTLHVAGFTIASPGVYASWTSSQQLRRVGDPSEILADLDVRQSTGSLNEIGYWPSYSQLSAENRYYYLKWLATGRRSLPPLEGFLFLFYYGLERRMLVDGQDRAWVLREVVRLRKLDLHRRGTAEGRSFRRYSSELLWYEVARAPELFDEASFEKVVELTEDWNDETIKPASVWLARHGKPLAGYMARAVARVHPRSVQSVVTKRVGKEFDDLFEKRFSDQFGAGLELRVPRRASTQSYRPASAGLPLQSCKVVSPTGLPSQFEPLADIWNSCVADLRRLSRISLPANGVLSVDAWEAMPEELRQDVDHPLAERLQQIVRESREESPEEQGDYFFVSIGRFAEAVDIARRPRLTLAQSRRLAETIGHSGHCVEPDARVAGRTYGWDELVSVYLGDQRTAVEVTRYMGAVCILRLGLAVAEANEKINPEELRVLDEQLEAIFDLPPNEQQRLTSLRALLLKTGSDLSALTKRLESSLPADARRSVGRLLVAIAAADGSVDRGEQLSLRKCFRALGLPPELLEAMVSEILPAESGGLTTVASASVRAAGEPLPVPDGLKLNRALIAAIMAETREVAKLLADAMTTEEVDQNEGGVAVARAEASVGPEPTPRSSAESSSHSRLPARFAAFWAELRLKAEWAREDAERMARGHNIMLGGAIEAINEWAFETHELLAIDDSGNILTIDTSVN